MITHPRVHSSSFRRAMTTMAVAALVAMVARPAAAQARPDSVARRDTRPARVPSDSAGRVRAVADSILLEDDPEDDVDLVAPAGPRSSISIQSLNRGYTIGTSTIGENVGLMTYRWTGGDWKAFFSGSPLRYSGNGSSVSGVPPISGRLDWAFAKGDTLRVYGRTASSPATLDSTQTAALGAVSVGTIDLESLSLGAPAMFGARVAFTIPLDAGISLGVRGGIEYQPRPSGSDRIYWTGTTFVGGATVSGSVSDLHWSGSVDVSRSTSDSLLTPGDSVGRNLFQGGGSLSATFQLDGPIASSSDATMTASLWFQRPFGADRPDQPNRLIPVGDSFGATMALDVPIGSWVLSPSVAVARESASDDARVSRLLRYQYSASSWAANAGVAITIPLARQLDLTPEVGGTFGNAEAAFTAVTSGAGGTGRRPGRTTSTGFNSGIRGWWAGVELTIRF